MDNNRGKSTGIRIVVSVIAIIVVVVVIIIVTRPGGITEGEAFSPTRDQTIKGGTYSITSMDIPKHVEIQFDGDTELFIEDDMVLNGGLSGDCVDLKIHIGGKMDVTGSIDNHCSETVEEPADLFIHVEVDVSSMGSSDNPVEISSSGDVNIVVGPILESWEYDLHPDIRSKEKLAPVCAATADPTAELLLGDEPVLVNFSANGIDPDGGPVSFAWFFTDESTTGEFMPSYEYDNEGIYEVVLIGTDDDGQMCEEKLTVAIAEISEDVSASEALGVFIEPSHLAVEQHALVDFYAEVNNLSGSEIGYEWVVEGDVYDSETLTYSFYNPGRHEISLVVRNDAGEEAIGTTSVYVYPEVSESAGAAHLARPFLTEYDCNSPDPVLVHEFYLTTAMNPPKSYTYDYNPLIERALMIGTNTNIVLRDGISHWVAEEGNGTVYGHHGGNGGSILFRSRISNDMVICGGTYFYPGNGGRGQDAVSKGTGVSEFAYARGGNGGKPGSVDFIVPPYRKVIIQGVPGLRDVNLAPGNGGDGGDAYAEGGKGRDDCASPGKGGMAKAVGGNGGSAKYMLSFDGEFRNGGKIIIKGDKGLGGDAGKGGNAGAVGGKGGNAKPAGGGNCQAPDCSKGATGGIAIAQGGKGGSASLGWNPATLLAPADITASFSGGKGGNVAVKGGEGGEGATCCTRENGSDGGKGGYALDKPGRGGLDRMGVRAQNGACGPLAILGENITACEGGDGGAGGDGLNGGGNGGKPGEGKGALNDGATGLRGGICMVEITIDKIKATFNRLGNILSFDIKIDASDWDTDIGRPIEEIRIEDQGRIYACQVDEMDYVDDETIKVDCEINEAPGDTVTLVFIDPEGNESGPYEMDVIFEGDVGAGSMFTACGVSMWHGENWTYTANCDEQWGEIFVSSSPYIDHHDVMDDARMLINPYKLAENEPAPTISDLYEQHYFDSLQVGTIAAVTVGGQPGELTTYEGNPPEVNYEVGGWTFTTHYNGMGYIFDFRFALENRDDYTPIFERMFDSIEFVEAAVEIPAAYPNEPEITGIEFPTGEPRKLNKADNEGEIPADGSKVWGLVRFNSPSSEIKNVWFDALDDWTVFDDFGFEITELVEGDYHLGAFEFYLYCNTPGFYSFSVSIEDQESQWSKWAVFMFSCK